MLGVQKSVLEYDAGASSYELTFYAGHLVAVAMRSRKPGQQVRITVRRGAAEVELLAVLGRRK